MDPGLNQLLKWGIENSVPARNGDQGGTNGGDGQPSSRGLNAELLAKIMGGPSDAELMKASMATIVSPSDSLEDKLTAFDNFEQLIESLDNANLLATLNLWDPLFAQLQSPESQLRFFAAWCIGTATQNNAPAQESVLKIGGIPTLVRVALEDADAGVRKKAAYALS
ncbi:MAG: hypothetical protein M1838_004892, partial [Thelocarpon superellum]